MGSVGAYRSRGYGVTITRSGGGGSVSPQPAQPAQTGPQIAQQAPNQSNTAVTQGALQAISSMNDDQLAKLVRDAKNASLPNFLADRPDITQQVVYQLGMNELPLVLDTNEFQKFLKDNGISKSQILTRSMNNATYTNTGDKQTTMKFTGNQLFDMLKYSRLNYIGGKKGGMALGAGTYLDRTGGRSNTGYGGVSNDAVLNPQYARVIDRSTLATKARSFAQSHPKFAKEVGAYSTGMNGTASVYALAMGYNVITSGSGYHNVIDRKALVWEKNTY